MSERGYQHKDEEFDAEDSRRSFLKKMGILGAGIAAGALGPKIVEDFVEHTEKAELSRLMESKTLNTAVPKGFGVDYFYSRSGWQEGEESVTLYGYRDAVAQLNPETNTSKLQEGEVITVPVRHGETLSQTE